MNVTSLFQNFNPFSQKPAVDPSAPPTAATPTQDAASIPAFDKTQNPNVTKDKGTDPQSPMDNFKDLFNLSDEDKKRVAEQGMPEKLFNVDPEKLNESVGKMSFIDGQQANQLFQQALKGDQTALTNLLNGVAQKVYLQAAQLSATLSEKAATTTADNFQKNLPQHFREMQAGEGLQQLNPAYAHPAFQPVIDGLKRQFLTKYPNATSGEITKMVSSYLDAMAQTRKAPEQDKGPQRNSTDPQFNWSEFFAPPQ